MASILPLLFSDWWEDLEGPHHVPDQNFGLGLHPEHLAVIPSDYYQARPVPRHRRPTKGYYYRPWGELMRKDDGGLSTVKSDKENFQVVLDVQQFNPDEINVKVSFFVRFEHCRHNRHAVAPRSLLLSFFSFH